MSNFLPLGVLVSGRGSNLDAIEEAIEAGRLAATIKVVICDQPGAMALDLASRRGLPVILFERDAFSGRAAFEEEIVRTLFRYGVRLVVLAGFMRLVGPILLGAFPDKIINIHPSLLPSFPGLSAQRQALDYGVKFSGCTVHYVNGVMDGGRIIAQAVVPVQSDDTEETLSARILTEEHRLLPQAIGFLVF